MKIAVTSQNFRTVTPHAGRTRRFLVYEVGEDGEPREVDRLDLPKHMSLHDFRGGAHPLDEMDVIITGGFGEGFAQRMATQGLRVAQAASEDPVAAVRAYLRDPAAAESVRGCGHGHAHGHAHAHAHGADHAHGQGGGCGHGQGQGLGHGHGHGHGGGHGCCGGHGHGHAHAHHRSRAGV